MRQAIAPQENKPKPPLHPRIRKGELKMNINKMGSAKVAAQECHTGSVTSRDGTVIGYRQLGHGPGLVILHGSMSTGYNHLQLAELLADVFTVYLPDRRSFGLSGPYGREYTIQNDVEDLNALLDKTGAHKILGVSAGSIICLKAALTLPAIHKLAIYEPPLFTDSAVPKAIMTRFDQEMAQGKVASALTTSMKGVPLMSDFFSAMPRWLLEFMTNKMISSEDKKGGGNYASFRELAPTLHHDGQVIIEMSGQQESLKAIRAEVLLLGGSKSTAFLKAGMDSVAKVLPHARRVEFPGLNHSSTWNTDRGGKPQLVAQELRRFFA
jgi:pimeloyl-ACP methyl ester carboxylesterase